MYVLDSHNTMRVVCFRIINVPYFFLHDETIRNNLSIYHIHAQFSNNLHPSLISVHDIENYKSMCT